MYSKIFNFQRNKIKIKVKFLIFNFQFSIFNFQFSIFNFQLSIFNFQFSTEKIKIKVKLFQALKILYILLAKNTIQFHRFIFWTFQKN